MPRVSEAFLAELGLQRADHPVHEWGNDPGSKLRRACLTHEVMMRMLELAEALAPFLKLDMDVVFGLLRDLVIEGAVRSPFGLVAREQGTESPEEAAARKSTTISELVTEAAKLTEARHGRPRAPEWAVALDA